MPLMTRPKKKYKTHMIKLFDGRKRQIFDTGEEKPYPDGKVIVSSTDINGTINFVNDAFVNISGYTYDELIGRSHSILRHPDMPNAAFKDLWDTIKAGKKWHGYVKNLCKDGDYYWVYATVVPNVRRGEVVGYTSVRRKPSRKKIAEAEALYKTLD